MRNKQSIIDLVREKFANFELTRGRKAAVALGLTASFAAFLLVRRYFREEVDQPPYARYDTTHDPIIICPDAVVARSAVVRSGFLPESRKRHDAGRWSSLVYDAGLQNRVTQVQILYALPTQKST